ncbi:MAG: hypothetical protein H7Y36_01960, partial [Armatimonadetes bacterium]|nr:hypothetical protein [Akkermansiaceae bacterium]
MAKLISTKMVDLPLFKTPALAPEIPFFHNASLSATGLLTNVRSGGMKKDLSFLLEKPYPPPSPPDLLHESLYKVGGTPGINFFELWRDYNVWGELKYGNIPAHADGKQMTPGIPYLETLQIPKDAWEDPFINHKALTKIQATVVHSLYVETITNPDSTKLYRLFLVVDPIYHVWNPYNVAMRVPEDTFVSFKSWAIPYNLKLDFISPTIGKKTVNKTIQDIIGADNFYTGEIGKKTVQRLILRPGEVQIISQGFNKPVSEGLKGNRYVDALLGWDFGSGFKFEIQSDDPAKGWKGDYKITWSMSPDNQATYHSEYGVFLDGYTLGEADRKAGEPSWHIGSMGIDFYGTRPSGRARLKANNFPQIFPTLQHQSLPAKTIEELSRRTGGKPPDKWPLCAFTFGMRTALDPMNQGKPLIQQGSRFLGRTLLHHNPRTPSYNFPTLDPDLVRAMPLQVGMHRLDSLSSLVMDCDATGLGYYGNEYGSNTGVSYLVQYSVPTKPIHSLGALQHSIGDGSPKGMSGEIARYLMPSISHPISNSFAPSIMNPGQTETKLGSDQENAADHSYLANRALWDDYFFSSISPET